MQRVIGNYSKQYFFLYETAVWAINFWENEIKCQTHTKAGNYVGVLKQLKYALSI